MADSRILRSIRSFFFNEYLSHKKNFHEQMHLLHRQLFEGEFSTPIFETRPCVICQESKIEGLFKTPEGFQIGKCTVLRDGCYGARSFSQKLGYFI